MFRRGLRGWKQASWYGNPPNGDRGSSLEVSLKQWPAAPVYLRLTVGIGDYVQIFVAVSQQWCSN